MPTALQQQQQQQSNLEQRVLLGMGMTSISFRSTGPVEYIMTSRRRRIHSS